MNDYIVAIRKVTGYSERRITQVMRDDEHGLSPLKLPGSMDWDVYLCYRAIREYERQTAGEETGEAG